MIAPWPWEYLPVLQELVTQCWGNVSYQSFEQAAYPLESASCFLCLIFGWRWKSLYPIPQGLWSFLKNKNHSYFILHFCNSRATIRLTKHLSLRRAPRGKISPYKQNRSEVPRVRPQDEGGRKEKDRFPAPLNGVGNFYCWRNDRWKTELL